MEGDHSDWYSGVNVNVVYHVVESCALGVACCDILELMLLLIYFCEENAANDDQFDENDAKLYI